MTNRLRLGLEVPSGFSPAPGSETAVAQARPCDTEGWGVVSQGEQGEEKNGDVSDRTLALLLFLLALWPRTSLLLADPPFLV